MIENENQEKPAYLRWKCLDDFSNMKKHEMFYNGSYVPSSSMIETLDPIFADIKARYTKQIQDLFEKKKQHVTLAGGIYSFFFSLPKMLKFISKQYPLLPVRLIFENINNLEDLVASNYDFVATVLYPGINENDFYGIGKTNYVRSRKVFKDVNYLAVAKEAVTEYDSTQSVLDHHNILFGRFGDEEDKRYLYSVAPKGRENENPKVVVDSYFMVYLMLRHNAGIAMGMKSMSSHEREHLLILKDHVLSNPNRFAIFKNHDRALSYCVQAFFKTFRNEGTCLT